MPYDVVGNEEHEVTERDRKEARRSLEGGGGGGDNMSSGGQLTPEQQKQGCLTCMLITGAIMCAAGYGFVTEALADDRGQKLTAFHEAVTEWAHGGHELFGSLLHGGSNKGPAHLGFVLRADHNGLGYGPGVDMAVTARHSSASTFGETDFDTDELKTPSLIEDISYRATARCPSNAPNQLCKIEVAARNGVTITKEITPAQQTGPTAMQEVSPGVCQWYDSDPWHPMAAVGLGACNNAMTGLGRPDTYNFGPSECVVDQYLDQHGCPADTIQSQQLVQAGWNWAPFLANKKRFAHEVVAGVAKCFDFTDCFCTGCGHTFKTDTTQGWGFTGYGYFANGQWAPFAKPFDQMTGSEKARQCSAAFASQGWTCPASSVNLVCFRAGGYPKKPCSRYCSEQSPSYAYTPPGVYPQMATFYGPWGLPRGQYPTGYSVEVPATCSWSETHTTQITRLRLVTDNLGHEHPSPWVSPHDVMVGEVPFEPSQLGAIELEVSVRSDQDPDLVGADLTQGCNLQPGEPYRCFGTSAGQSMSRGVGLLLLGLLLIGLAIFGCWQLAQVSGKSLF